MSAGSTAYGTVIRLLRRLEKAQRRLLGDVNPVGDGVFEMREFFGPGWRMYYMQQGDQLIMMLGGGDKSTRSKGVRPLFDPFSIRPSQVRVAGAETGGPFQKV